MGERAPAAASGRRVGLILCALLLAFAYVFVIPEGASAGEPAPFPVESCDILVEGVTNCATVYIFSDGGQGSGRITSYPEVIDCRVTAGVLSGTCRSSFIFGESSATVLLTFTAAPGSALGSPTGETEEVGGVILENTNSYGRAWKFVLTRHTLSVTKTGAGSGKVTSTPAGIDCAGPCGADFDYGTQVTLTAAPDAGAVFKAWTGACAGQGATCNLTVQGAISANVVFELPEAQGGGGAGGGGSGSSGGTTVGANTSGTTGATTSGGTASGKAKAAVAASVIRARSGKSLLGKRIVVLELNLEEKLSATLNLVRGKKTLLTKQVRGIKVGNRLLTLVIPKRVGQGKATLAFKLKDSAGNTFSGRRSIKIAAL